MDVMWIVARWLGRPRVVLLTAAAFVAAFWLVNVSGVPGLAHSETLGSIGILDMDYGYVPEQAFQKITAYGIEGREAYRQFLTRIDFAYPAIVGAFLCAACAAAVTHAFPGRRAIAVVAFAPLGLTAFDWLENLAILGMLSAYPVPIPWLARCASLFTLLKAAFGLAGVTLLIGLLGFLAWKGLRSWRGRGRQ